MAVVDKPLSQPAGYLLLIGVKFELPAELIQPRDGFVDRDDALTPLGVDLTLVYLAFQRGGEQADELGVIGGESGEQPGHLAHLGHILADGLVQRDRSSLGTLRRLGAQTRPEPRATSDRRRCH